MTRPAYTEPLALDRLVRAVKGLALHPLSAGGASVRGVCLDSRRVQSGDLYAALPGATQHGLDFLADALEAGAVAVLTDSESADRRREELAEVLEGRAVLLVAEDPRALLGAVSAEVYGHPSRELTMIGVTGTQGKTTTTLLAEGALRSSEHRVAAIGTVGTRIDGLEVPGSLTTPEAPDLHGLLATMSEQRTDLCLMEVSSHALVLGRVEGVVFDVAVFLNLGRDHLDFHADVEDYFAAKASLFTPQRAKLALVDMDTEWGRRLITQVEIPVRTMSASADDGDADWWVSDRVEDATGTDFVVHGPEGASARTRCPLPGRYNVSNTLAAIAACVEAGLAIDEVAAALATAPGVPGRLQQIENSLGVSVIVDYAHKPDAVQAALDTLRPLTTGRLFIVLGAGGLRDAGKRPLMAATAAELADVVVITDDNPRTEDPAAIRAEMMAGLPVDMAERAEVREIGDRREAITWAVEQAIAGDTVLIAGKGHETGQEIDGVTYRFDDREVAAHAIGAKADAVGDGS